MSNDVHSEPLLRTLSPALKELGRGLRSWLDGKHHFPLSTLTRANLEGLISDLNRQSEALQMEKPLLVIMLMGGTGVGKSTLLNALAGGAIAHASFARPTTRDPVVYYHESVQPQRLDPALRHCKLAMHDRPALEQKIIVDTPDLDSNDLANREKLIQLLPAADIVLYVGSQEKYHDQLGWQLFLKHRQRRAFAFVLNKWDRCVQAGTTGVRPDEDLLSDLKAEGFKNPLLFRTCAQFWVDQAAKENNTPIASERWMSDAETEDDSQVADHAPKPESLDAPATPWTSIDPPVEDEQFRELNEWLEKGLSRLEIEAIKARGVSQLLHHLNQSMQKVCPPDLTEACERTKAVWRRLLKEEADATAQVLLNTLEPYQKEIEHHFALERQSQFRGLMGGYLNLFNRIKYAGSSLRDRIPFMPRLANPVDKPSEWDLSSFTQACSSAATERFLDARNKALINRLLVEADKQGFPLDLLSESAEAKASSEWQARYSQSLIEVLSRVESEWAKPGGTQRLIQKIIVFLADWLPILGFGAMAGFKLWQYTMENAPFYFTDLLLPFVVVFMILVVLHVLIIVFLPLRWLAIREEFKEQLEQRLAAEMEGVYLPVPEEITDKLLEERRRVEKFLGEIREVTGWLEQQEQAASIEGLYGN